MSLSYTKFAEGVAELAMPYGESTPLKTYTCGHCGGVGYVNPEAAIKHGVILRGSEPPPVCHRCWKLVCPRCHQHGNCTTVEQVLAKLEANSEFHRALGEVQR